MDSKSKFQCRIQRRLYHNSEMTSFNKPSLPLTEATVEYFQDSFPGCEGLGRLDTPMAATISKQNPVSPCSMVMSMLYAKRLRQRSKQYLQSMSSTDVFFISMMMASKYIYDEGVDEEVYNDEWATSIGHEVEDVNQMEMDFLKEMDWQLFVKPEEFDQALTAIERRLALKEGVKRGWFTYTELAVLLDWDPVYNLWNQVGLDCTKVVSLLSAVYVASLVSMMGSAAIALQVSGPMATATLAVLSSFHMPRFTGNTLTAIHFPCQPLKEESAALVDIANESVPLPVQIRLSEGSTHLHKDGFEGLEFDRILENSSTSEEGTGLRLGLEGQDAEREAFLSEAMAANKSGQNDKGGGTRQDRKEESDVMKVKRASVLSLWLFDSFLTQVWSTFSHQEKSGSIRREPDSYPSQHCPNCDGAKKCETGRGRHCINKHINTGDSQKCKRCQSRRSQTRSFPNPRFNDPVSKDFAPLADRVGHNNEGTVQTTRDRVGFVESGISCGSKTCVTLDQPTWHTPLDHLDYNERLASPQCRPVSEADSDQSISNGAAQFCSPPLNVVEMNNGCGRIEGSTHHLTPSKAERSLDLVLPISLMEEVPILDPVGFFTRNTGPVYVLST